MRLDNTSCHTLGDILKVTLKKTPNTLLLLKSTQGAGVPALNKSEMKVLLNVFSFIPNVDLERYTTSFRSKIVWNTIL